MTKWTSLFLALAMLAVVSVNASPIGDGATNKVMGRQDTAPSAEVVPAAPANPAAPAAEEEEDDDDEEDEYDLPGLDDDDEEEDEAEDDDDDDDDDYFESFFDDILGDDDDDDEVKPPKPSTAATSTTSSGEGAGNAVSPTTESSAEDYDEEDEEDEDTAGAESSNVESSSPATEEEGEDEEGTEKEEGAEEEDGDDDDDDDENELADELGESDEDDEEEADDYETDIVTAKRARGLAAGNVNKTPKMPASHLAKYNRFVDSIIGRINDVLKKSFDPVTVRLTRGSPAPPSRRPVSDPKNVKVGEQGPTYELVSVSRNEDLPLQARNTPARTHRAKKNKNKGSNKQNRQRARATLIGLSSLRREGDVTVNTMAEHTTVRSRFLLGPLVLRVEKQFGRGAKKELRSATATTDKMTGRMVLRVNQSGVATLHSIRVLQPKQVRVESDDDHDRTREFVWRRSSHIAHLVSQKLSKAARELLQAKPATESESSSQ